MEKRVLLAVTLSFLVLVVYQSLVPKPAPRPAARPITQGSASATSGTAGAAAGGSAATPAGTSTNAPGQAAAPGAAGDQLEAGREADRVAKPLVADTGDHDIVVETTHVRAVFGSRGAVLKSWVLKHYLDAHGKPVDMLPPGNLSVAARPFALSIPNDAGLTERIQQGLYRPSATSLELAGKSDVLRFEYADANGLRVQKAFTFQPEGKPYVVIVDVRVENQGAVIKPTIHGGAGIGDLERSIKPSGFLVTTTYQLPEAIFQKGRDVHRVHFASLPQQPIQEGTFEYAGVDDHYFLGALLPPDNVNVRVDYAPVFINTPVGPRELVDYRVRIGGNQQAVNFFYGPKDFDILAGVDRDLVRAIHFGWFSFLAVPLLRSLKWVDAYVGNYGWSIVILTVLINLAMFPLRHKSVVSMRKMQQIQPEVKAIQDRYAKLKVTDPARQKMNTELMNLYRERGVNPASGCVPMLLTMPVLFAFYSLLSVAIELRGAPFMLWIQDLSSFDPLFVTPVLMGATQFLQTRMTPMTGDPAQQRMMMFMPLIFMVFFLWMPAGLVLYWFVSNLWTIGQQLVTNRLIGPPPAHVVRPVAQSRAKRQADGGK